MGVMSPAVDAPGSVLVYVGLDLVGDGLIRLPFVRALRNAFPSAEITWLAGRGRSVYAHALAPLVEGLIDEVVEEADVGRSWTELLARPLRGTALQGRHFDLVIDSQRRVATTLLVKRIPHRTFVSGTARFRFSELQPGAARPAGPAAVGRLLELVELASGRPADTSPPLVCDLRFDRLAERLLPAGRSYVGFSPGGPSTLLCWPLERFLALAEAQLAAGRVPVIFLGPQESDWAETVSRRLPDALLPLQDEATEGIELSPILTIALARRLSVAVANDTGVGHMFAAADCPLVSLFGPTRPEKFAPLVSRRRVLRAQDHGGTEMACIPQEAVEDAVNALLDEEDDRRATPRPAVLESRLSAGVSR